MELKYLKSITILSFILILAIQISGGTNHENQNNLQKKGGLKGDHGSPLISVIVPTWQRQDRHEALYNVFMNQDYSNKELLVLDDSDEPSAFFVELEKKMRNHDGRVRYWHVKQKTTIGSKRQTMINLAGGSIIAHFDDDDYYAPIYLSRMFTELGQFHLVKQSNWTIHREFDNTLWNWDTSLPWTPESVHYQVDGSGPIQQVTLQKYTRHMNLWGYGFSFMYLKSLAVEIRFSDMDFGEDYDFVKRALDSGKSIKHVTHLSNLSRHTIHDKSSSRVFPQQKTKVS